MCQQSFKLTTTRQSLSICSLCCEQKYPRKEVEKKVHPESVSTSNFSVRAVILQQSVVIAFILRGDDYLFCPPLLPSPFGVEGTFGFWQPLPYSIVTLLRERSYKRSLVACILFAFVRCLPFSAIFQLISSCKYFLFFLSGFCVCLHDTMSNSGASGTQKKSAIDELF